MSKQEFKLFSSLTLGSNGSTSFKLKHRVAMAPLTRCRAVAGDCEHTDLGVTYYQQRSSEGGLIISEATQITPQGQGYPATPGIYSSAQIEAWKKITDAVHKKGGIIACQLWHVGRVRWADSVSSSSVALGEHATDLKTMQQVPAEAPRALTVEEIKQVVEQYGVAAKNAIEAGFDLVELHAANGYLIDQFLQDGVNKRTDEYGGSIENRIRFLKEVVESVLSHLNNESYRVGVRISPSGVFNNMSDSNPQELFTEVAKLLNNYNLAYLHVIEPRSNFTYSKAAEEVEAMATVACKQLRPYFSNPIIAAGGFNRQTAIDIVESGDADLVAFGRYFISNPDLPLRFEKNLPLNVYNRESFYYSADMVTGYTDYPFYSEEQ
ncbi:hypothetical protein C9374_009500 [Naegleria lovaniensis]|uniref:NADH:flavin oxidoreductase/NADH oxidase N-terminal domain-containing protein n=1 Tax=Naegleria lovaniensis TaxID=51637 RepID=A0AA88H1F1_NAELO|nr:uncharacterized protein C9374_009500 [Naegleria lovaniensis]KAG2392923.1 hypothetical protein C9374_009500 [Naegleria lovaniensis]